MIGLEEILGVFHRPNIECLPDSKKESRMKKRSIKSHLSLYSIFQKRRTTINHVFASAIAPVDEYDEVELGEAIRSLGQDPEGDLQCIYCGLRADTWDHLVDLVKNALNVRNRLRCRKNSLLLTAFSQEQTFAITAESLLPAATY